MENKTDIFQILNLIATIITAIIGAIAGIIAQLISIKWKRNSNRTLVYLGYRYWIISIFVFTVTVITYFSTNNPIPYYNCRTSVLVQYTKLIDPKNQSLASELQTWADIFDSYSIALMPSIQEKSKSALNLNISENIKINRVGVIINFTVNANDKSTAELFLVRTVEDLIKTVQPSVPDVIRFSITPPISEKLYIRPTLFRNLAIAILFSLSFSILCLYLIDFRRKTIKTSSEISNLFNAPIVGFIGRNKENVLTEILSPFTDSFRYLRTQIMFSEKRSPLQTILITSPMMGDGKTTIAVNLAKVISLGNENVLLIDADLRKPKVHIETGIANENGLSDYLNGDIKNLKIINRFNNKFSVLPSGSLINSSSIFLHLREMGYLLGTLKGTKGYIIIDSAPLFIPDTLALANMVDGVIIVVRPGHTEKEAAEDIVETLKQNKINVIGIVINGINQKRAGYYQGNSKKNYSE